MYLQVMAPNATRLAMILLFLLPLAGCGGSDSHPDQREAPHPDQREEQAGEFSGRLMVLDAQNHRINVFDLESERVVAAFDDPDGFEASEAPGFGELLRRTSDGGYGLVMQRTGHFAPDNDPSANRIYVVDSGLTVEGHGGHLDPVREEPTLLPYQLGHGGGDSGLYRPIHFSSHHGLTAIFYDGSRHPDDDLQNVNGYAVAYKNSQLAGRTLPDPRFKLDVGSYAHGAAVAFHDNLFIVSVGMNEGYGGLDYSSLPRGVATYRADAEEVEDFVQDFRGRCPRLHGEAVSGNYVAFGCNEGPEDNEAPTYMGPDITKRSGILVLTYDKATDSFDAAEVAYPDDGSELTSGGLAGGIGPSKGIMMATYGEHFLKIQGSEIRDGTDEGVELLRVEAGSGRHRGYAFEPVDHHFGGEGRFVVLTATGHLYIFDLTAAEPLVGTVTGIVGATCPEGIGCPSLALAPGFAYVTDPAASKVYEVSLEEAEIKREWVLNAPTRLVVLGWFGLEAELEFH